ncbi:glycosyltransferase [Pelagibacteraceae bacterium]|nr:glycosyltransferase [Pelagibacteraceae bacterium]MDC0339621.1 glycosyltransferase [Pelagibacteraceae bacterium]MDC0366264.1 glycosyltransferase [Pelagibacteraceae bacterium]
MKISILLPYKENFSPEYPGAVSLFVYETSKKSSYRKKITVFGSTNLKKKFPIKYNNITLPKYSIGSQTKIYVNRFINLEKKNKSSIIEIHNRPSYVKIISSKIKKNVISIYFHNDPLSMDGSKSVNDRKFLLNKCHKIIFNSNWSKKRFLEGLENRFVNSNKLSVFYQSASRGSVSLINKKKKWITFVGKLNKAKGYDIFAKAIVKVLNKNSKWKAKIIGDEKREKIKLNHKNADVLGFKKHEEVIKIFKETSIAVACSRWEEPFGRTSLEASANGCAVIITNKGGLPETVTNAKILNSLTVNNLEKNINNLIKNTVLRKKLQKLSIQNFNLTHDFITKEIDNYRSEKLNNINKFNTKKSLNNLRILHITNFNERLDGRLFFNTGRRINNGFIRLGHSVLGFSDRDIQKYYKSFSDIKGAKTLNDKLKKTCYNYKPDLIIMGHADLISSQQISELKDDYPNVRVGQWFLDPLNKNGPDFERNKDRIMDKIEVVDASFLTTSPSALSFLPKNNNIHYIPNPGDKSFEVLNNYKKSCNVDVFFALSHGVHRGVLKTGKIDDRVNFVNNLITKTPDVKFDIYGLNKVQPIWADHYFKTIANAKMGLNLSRGDAIKYYSSDRITQIIGNGLACLIDEKTEYRDFFNDNEMVFYKNLNDLSEKILKIAQDEKLRKSIAEKGKDKYMKYFNSNLVAEFIINKTLNITSKNKFFWES